jgi:hypothetical protein
MAALSGSRLAKYRTGDWKIGRSIDELESFHPESTPAAACQQGCTAK